MARCQDCLCVGQSSKFETTILYLTEAGQEYFLRDSVTDEFKSKDFFRYLKIISNRDTNHKTILWFMRHNDDGTIHRQSKDEAIHFVEENMIKCKMQDTETISKMMVADAKVVNKMEYDEDWQTFYWFENVKPF